MLAITRELPRRCWALQGKPLIVDYEQSRCVQARQCKKFRATLSGNFEQLKFEILLVHQFDVLHRGGCGNLNEFERQIFFSIKQLHKVIIDSTTINKNIFSVITQRAASAESRFLSFIPRCF